MSVIKNKRTKIKVDNTMENSEVGNNSSGIRRINRLLAGSVSQSAFPSNAWGNVVDNIGNNVVDIQSLYTLTSNATFYSNQSTYSVNDVVITLPDYANAIPAHMYKCITEISTPEDFNPAHWESTNLLKLIRET